MKLVIDAYNVLHCTHILPARYAMISPYGLCQLVDRSVWRGHDTLVVCDGALPLLVKEPPVPAGTQVIYAGGGKDADSLIEHIIEQDTATRDMSVVSNDRRIQRAAKRRKAKVVASEAFLRSLVRNDQVDESTHTKPTKIGEHDEWMDIFADESDPKPTTKPNGKPASETERWMREFGFDGNESDVTES